MTVGLLICCLTHLIPLYSYMLLQQLITFSSLTLIKPSVNVNHGYYFGVVLRRTLIILMSLTSGNVHPNPGPSNGDTTPIASNFDI